MPDKEYSKKEVAEMLVEKHANALEEYDKKYSALDRIVVLEEVVDQLSHWIKDKGDVEEYIKKKEEAERELKELKSKHPESKKKMNEFKDKLNSHKEALEHWRGI